MQKLIALVAFAVAGLWGPVASAQPIVTPDPARYASELSNNMAVGGVAPLRELFGEMQRGAALPPDVEAALLPYERAVTQRRAVIGHVIDDVMLSDVYRALYLYHYYGENFWLFTRLDFVRIGDEWALSGAAFGSDWSKVALISTPGFRSVPLAPRP